MDRFGDYSYSLHFSGEPVEHDGLDDYLRLEFAEAHPGWDPTHGRVSHYDDDVNSRDYAYLLTGDVPGASSLDEAEKKVEALVHDLRQRLRLPAPKIRVWQSLSRRSRKDRPAGG